jgi:hypothetical protein
MELRTMKRLLLMLPFALFACDGSVTDPAVAKTPGDPSLSITTPLGVFTYFDDFNLGTIDGQQDWLSAGANNHGCAKYDAEVVANTFGYFLFGAKSLRISNAVTSGCFGDHTFSARTLTAAGEAGSLDGGFDLGGGARRNHFDAAWTFASTVKGARQPGLSVVASPDRGDGARMSWVQMTDEADGLAVNFYDVQGLDPDDHISANFKESFLVRGLNRAVPHTIAISMDFREGPGNDIVRVYVDGRLRHTGTSWEDYFRFDPEAAPFNHTPPMVNRVLFRTGGAAAPGTAGNGFLIDNLVLATYNRAVSRDD